MHRPKVPFIVAAYGVAGEIVGKMDKRRRRPRHRLEDRRFLLLHERKSFLRRAAMVFEQVDASQESRPFMEKGGKGTAGQGDGGQAAARAPLPETPRVVFDIGRLERPSFHEVEHDAEIVLGLHGKLRMRNAAADRLVDLLLPDLSRGVFHVVRLRCRDRSTVTLTLWSYVGAQARMPGTSSTA